MGSRAEALNRKRLRYGLGIGFEEYNKRNIDKVRELQSEMIVNEYYVGYFDTYGDTMRVFVFEKDEGRDAILKIAKELGFDSAGPCEGIISISNAELQRPHLDRIKNRNTFYKELYR